jgi:hypothetical protein
MSAGMSLDILAESFRIYNYYHMYPIYDCSGKNLKK